jgi:hypothetical protein
MYALATDECDRVVANGATKCRLDSIEVSVSRRLDGIEELRATGHLTLATKSK